MSSNLKRRLAIGAAALAAVAFGGGAYAATQSSVNPRQAFLNDLAKRLNVSPKQLSSAISGAALDQLNAAVKAGKLTRTQADAIKREIQEHGGLPPFGAWIGPRGFAHPFFRVLPGGPRVLPGGPRMLPGGPPGGPMGGAVHGPLAGAASYLGITDAQLFSQLAAGKSLAQIAQARGKSVSGLKQAMAAALKARLDKAVAAKILTSAQEQQILKHISALVDRKVSRAGYGPRFRFFRGRAGSLHSVPGGPPAGLVPGVPPAGVIPGGPEGVPVGPPSSVPY